LLPLVTQFEETKTVRHTTARFTQLSGAWAALNGVSVTGYEIHHGVSSVRADLFAGKAKPGAVLPVDLAWQNTEGNVLGVYVHGLFEDAAVLQALFGASTCTLESVFDEMAQFIETHFLPGTLQQLIG
jgi:adenosylcobyric acid synthase